MNKILLTGAGGFLGKIITNNLTTLCEIITLGRSANMSIRCDLSNEIPNLPNVDLVIHAAGKAHVVSKNAADSKDFYDVNVEGTKHLLLALEKKLSQLKSFIFISSVAVYGAETGTSIGEDAPLSALDPYGKSKVLAEEMIQAWCAENNIICTILRLPLLAGPNPPGNLKSMINGIKKGFYFNIGGGIAKKSIVLAEDVAAILPVAAKVGGIYNLTDRQHPSFKQLSSLIAAQTAKKEPKNMPVWLGISISKIGDILGRRAPLNSRKLKKIMLDLTFNDDRAVKHLGWNPKSVIETFIIQ